LGIKRDPNETTWQNRKAHSVKNKSQTRSEKNKKKNSKNGWRKNTMNRPVGKV